LHGDNNNIDNANASSFRMRFAPSGPLACREDPTSSNANGHARTLPSRAEAKTQNGAALVY